MLRRLAERFILLLLAGLVARTWFVEGLLVPYRVASGSMAPTLLGPHFDMVCPDCGFSWACDSSRPPLGRRAVCPNCGYRVDWPPPDSALAGDRLLVDKSTFRLRSPQRWEVVAVRQPDHAARVAIKRVVGLPGESVQIRDGDLYIDGRIQRKPLAQQRATAVLVHDASHPPRLSHGLPPRWSGDGPASRWKESEGRFIHAAGEAAGANEPAMPVGNALRGVPGVRHDAIPPATERHGGRSLQCPPKSVSPGGHAGSIDWLRYRHWRRIPGDGQTGQAQPAPITNKCGYNAARECRESMVRDLLLAFRLVRTCGPGRLVVATTDGRREFQVEIDPSRASYVVLEDGHPLTGAGGSPLPAVMDGRQIEVWLADARLVLLIDGRPVFVRCYESDFRQQGPVGNALCGVPKVEENPIPAFAPERHAARSLQRNSSACSDVISDLSQPLAIGTSGLGVEITDVRVYRDIDYCLPTRVRARWGYDKPVRLGKDDYFLLGDNSEVSVDSRYWIGGPAVPASLLVGKPLLVHFPCRGIMIGGRHFQVPDISRIRYIR